MYRIIVLFLTLLLISCADETEMSTLNMEDLYAWCIVPFDIKERTPQQRMHMLKKLGFKKYVYDWRTEDLPFMIQEWELAKENDIEILGVWMWLDNRYDQPGQLSKNIEQVFSALRQTDLQTQIWVSFNENFFMNLTDEEAVEKGVKMFDYLATRADSLNCTVALYNHGGWFGEPENQIKIINALPQHDLGLVYNFHHAHTQVERFPELVKLMLPYLNYVNLNGMKKEGPKILPIGKGDREKEMLTLLLDKGFSGPFGILGHVEDADVELVLKENLEGLSSIINY